ncbi:MAG: diguanylate cyclase (GGDEF)-like protein [Planctomycetota bacterium]|jgi:diguanylate cyclase (GGDEF)-like protein
MGDGLRTIHIVTTDDSLLADTRAAAKGLDGWEIQSSSSRAELLESPPVAGDVLLLDAMSGTSNVYEDCRRLAGRTKCRTFVVVEAGNDLAESIACFCGATGVLQRPFDKEALGSAIEQNSGPRPALPQEARGSTDSEFVLPQALLKDITTGETDKTLVDALIDPETGLFNYAYLNYKVDEEYKRARRFEHPLTCVMLGFEGQANESVLAELAGIFLNTSRDTDILGRFDENSFLFLLPNTGPDGAGVMADRIREMAESAGLQDLVGDSLVLAAGIASCPNPGVSKPEDLYGQTRDAFFAARAEGGGVVVA